MSREGINKRNTTEMKGESSGERPDNGRGGRLSLANYKGWMCVWNVLVEGSVGRDEGGDDREGE